MVLLLEGADGLRKARARISTVPVLNYEHRHSQVQAAGLEAGTFTWVVKAKPGVQDEQLVAFCGGECSFVGHPGRGGIPLVTVRATEKKLEQMLEANPGIAEFVEPDSPPHFAEAEQMGLGGEAPWGHAAIDLAYAQYT